MIGRDAKGDDLARLPHCRTATSRRSRSTPSPPAGSTPSSAALRPAAADWIAASGFTAAAGRVLPVPGADGRLAFVLLRPRRADARSALALLAGTLPAALPAGTYRLDTGFDDPALATLAFALGAYRFTRYRAGEAGAARWSSRDGIDAAGVTAHRRWRHAGPRSRQHRRQRPRARPNSPRRRRTSPSATARASR